MKNLINHSINNRIINLILVLLCGFVFLMPTNVQSQSLEKKDKFFEAGGIKIGMNLPILIHHSNENTPKPFGTYHVGMDVWAYGKSKEILPNTKLVLYGGYFTFADIVTFLNAAFSDPSTSYNNYRDDSAVIAIGLEGGASFIFGDVLEIGATIPWATGNTENSNFKRISGVTPNIQYRIKTKHEIDYAIKCQFPIWKKSLKETGLIIGVSMILGD